MQKWPWVRGVVVIASAFRTKDPGFKAPTVCKVLSSLRIAELRKT
jgi:hypothetical protein